MLSVIRTIAVILLCTLVHISVAVAQEEAPTAVPLPSPEAASEAVADAPLTVSGVIADKTDKNAVAARKAAIAEAKRAALRKLAERRLGSAASSFVLPDDQMIAALVQDFEITDEQISATRYVGTFTVRFTPRAEEVVGGSAPAPEVPAAETPAPAPTGPRTVLILPYFETDAARLLLWEDTNAWLKAWQAAVPAVSGWTVTVPLGDINDVAAGSSDAVWSGDLAPVRKLLENYAATEAVLPVATKTEEGILVDLYVFREDRLNHLPALPLVPRADNDAATWRTAVADVMRELQKPPAATPPAAEESAVPGPDAATPPAVENPGTGVPVSLEVEMSFDGPAQWIEAQRRLASLTPPATVEIRSLSSGSVVFTLGFSGSLETLTVALEAQGLLIETRPIQVDEMMSAVATASTPVYELKFADP